MEWTNINISSRVAMVKTAFINNKRILCSRTYQTLERDQSSALCAVFNFMDIHDDEEKQD